MIDNVIMEETRKKMLLRVRSGSIPLTRARIPFKKIESAQEHHKLGLFMNSKFQNPPSPKTSVEKSCHESFFLTLAQIEIDDSDSNRQNSKHSGSAGRQALGCHIFWKAFASPFSL